MKYVVRSKTIASEVTAKPPRQASAYLLRVLREQPKVARAVDYGCGRLRYVRALARMADGLTIVDSADQLDRITTIRGMNTTVRHSAQRSWPDIRIETVVEFRDRATPKFGFALCANVLSAIPSRAERAKALEAIKRRLIPSGRLLVVNQHTNSFYCEISRRKDAIPHLDGFLVTRSNQASYFGILDKSKTAAILRDAGFKIEDQWISGQSNYALARP